MFMRRRVTIDMLGPWSKWARHMFGTRADEAPGNWTTT
jgi:hypothetical protein